jgi:HlyD family secretion protein
MVRSAPILVQNVVHYNTIVAVDNPGWKLKPGMTATVAILVAQRANVLKVPKAALRFQPVLTARAREQLGLSGRERLRGQALEGAQPPRQNSQGPPRPWHALPHVWVPTLTGLPQPVAVHVGLSDDQFTEATEDSLQEGQEVIVGVHGHSEPGTGRASAAAALSGSRQQL